MFLDLACIFDITWKCLCNKDMGCFATCMGPLTHPFCGNWRTTMYKHIEFTTRQSLFRLLQDLLIGFWFQFSPCLFIYMPQPKTPSVSFAVLQLPQEGMPDGDPRDLRLFSLSRLSCLCAEHCCTASTSSLVGFSDPWSGPLFVGSFHLQILFFHF